MNKHTPGPWTVSTAPGTVDVRSPDGGFIASVDIDKRMALAEIDANARLLAAAPDLLIERDALRAALRAVVADLERELPQTEFLSVAHARAVIAKGVVDRFLDSYGNG